MPHRALLLSGLVLALTACSQEKVEERQAEMSNEAATDPSAAITAVPTNAPPPQQGAINSQ